VALLVGTPALELKDFGTELRPVANANSAVLYLAGGQRFGGRYDKMHLVPFGEVVPFKQSWPWLHRLLNGMTPYDFDYTLDAGQEPKVFQFRSGERDWRFGVAICYEDVTAWVPRCLAVADGAKRIDFLLNISNDGWFVSGGKDTPIKATGELLQHLAICKFRAVENRIGIARAVNTGISGFIRPDGQVQTKGQAGTLPDDPRARQTVTGFLTDRVYTDTRISLYSRWGDVFAIACVSLTGLSLVCTYRGKKS
jgi:apolipoprotein N-acyltransferase